MIAMFGVLRVGLAGLNDTDRIEWNRQVKTDGRERMTGKMRIGHGYDAHRFAPDRPLILGGVVIPYDKGLLGHSDADVLAHAVMDALLGAAALPDIGKQFPDGDPAYEGISSMVLLKRVRELLRDAGCAVVNIDATIIAQAPKLAGYTEKMTENIASALGIEPGCLNVKATTEEGLGFTGRGEGISAHAVCLLTEQAGTEQKKEK